jgi:hypothetical protein
MGWEIRSNTLHLVLCFTLLLTASTVGVAQQSANQWQGVEALKPGTNIRIKLPNKRVMCAFDSANDDGLICHKREAGVDRSISLPKTEIQLIRARNATGSVVVGTVIGIGIGAGIGAIVDSSIKNPNTTNNAKFTRGLAPVGGLLGGLFGVATGFVPGKLLYTGDIQHP